MFPCVLRPPRSDLGDDIDEGDDGDLECPPSSAKNEDPFDGPKE